VRWPRLSRNLGVAEMQAFKLCRHNSAVAAPGISRISPLSGALSHRSVVQVQQARNRPGIARISTLRVEIRNCLIVQAPMRARAMGGCDLPRHGRNFFAPRCSAQRSCTRIGRARGDRPGIAGIPILSTRRSYVIGRAGVLQTSSKSIFRN